MLWGENYHLSCGHDVIVFFKQYVTTCELLKRIIYIVITDIHDRNQQQQTFKDHKKVPSITKQANRTTGLELCFRPESGL